MIGLSNYMYGYYSIESAFIDQKESEGNDHFQSN